VPGIYRLGCGSCDYAVRGIMSRTTVIMDDGSEKLCPHPCERMIAERATGKKWFELARANRLVYRYALVCLACGELDYYGPRDLSAEVRASGHIWSIVHQPSLSETSEYSCKACAARQVYPLCGERGCLLALFQLFGLFRERRVACPKCQKGSLQSKGVAIS
jgi:hypothetical protein